MVFPLTNEISTRHKLDQRQFIRRRIVVSLCTLALLLATIGYGSFAAFATVPLARESVSQFSTAANKQVALTVPQFEGFALKATRVLETLGSTSENAVEESSSIPLIKPTGLLAAKDENQPRPMASITKVITALVLLQDHPIVGAETGPIITYNAADVAIYYAQIAVNGSVAPVNNGLVLSLKDSLIAMLVPSANNYALSLANWDAGSQTSFVSKMRAWLQSNHFIATNVVEPDGFSDENVSTATELLRLGEIAMQNPVIREIVALKQVVLPNIGMLENTNMLLGTHGVIGMKTGSTDTRTNLLFVAQLPVTKIQEFGVTVPTPADTETPASSVVVGPTVVSPTETTMVEIFGVALGALSHNDINQAVTLILDQVRDGFIRQQLPTATIALSYATSWGSKSQAVLAEGTDFVTWGTTVLTVTVTPNHFHTAAKGTVAGYLLVQSAGVERARRSLVLNAELTEPDFWWRLSHPGELG